MDILGPPNCMICTDFSGEGLITWQVESQGNRGNQVTALTKLKFLGKDQVTPDDATWFPGCAVEELCRERLTDNMVSTLTKWSRVINSQVGEGCSTPGWDD